MPHYLFVYHGGKTPESPKEGEKVMAEWMGWFNDMGEAVVNPGAPVGMSTTVSSSEVADNGGANPASGFSIIAAADLEAACDIAKGCPMVRDGSGSVELAEIVKM